ncbi:hypothetical protein BGZ92_004020, partial [Podila epicladia]
MSSFDSLFDYMLHDSYTPAQTPFARGAFHPLDYESPTNPYLTRLRSLLPDDEHGSTSEARGRGGAEAGAGPGPGAGVGAGAGMGGLSMMEFNDFPFFDHALGHVHSLLDRVNRTVTEMYTPSRRTARHPT